MRVSKIPHIRLNTSVSSRILCASVLLWCVLCVAGTWTEVACARAEAGDAGLVTLLNGIESKHAAGKLRPTLLEQVEARYDRAHPNWPLATFLVSEAHRLRGDETKALDLNRSLALWAAHEEAYDDGWGGSGLAALALWRWQRALLADPNARQEDLIGALEAGQALLIRRLVAGMFSYSIFEALPQLDEEIRRAWPKMAWAAGNRNRALHLFVDFLKTAGAENLDPKEQTLLEELREFGIISEDWLLLLRGVRLMELRRYWEARKRLEEAVESDNPEVKAEAGLALSKAIFATEPNALKTQLGVVSRVIKETNSPNTAQRALLERGYIYKRAGRYPEMVADFETLANNHRMGDFTDDALVELARYYQDRHKDEEDLEQASDYYLQLRNFLGDKNDWADTAVYQAAITFYTMGEPFMLKKARIMRQDYLKREVPAPTRRVALFWLGRIAEDLDSLAEAENYFRLTIAEMPYDYYALRARMHLNVGPMARSLVEPDADTRASLAAEFKASTIDDGLNGSSPYVQRLNDAWTSGLYRAVLAIRNRLTRDFPGRRTEEIGLGELDHASLLGPLAVLMALRLDALAAKDVVPTSTQRLSVAAALGRTGDVPFATYLAGAFGEQVEWRGEAQQNPRFLATAFPRVFHEAFSDAAAAYGLHPGLLYAIARRESAFDPFAISESGKVGLFQFSASSFRDMNPDGQLLRQADVRTWREFLIDPERSIRLGAKSFKEQKLQAMEGNLVWAVMAHHAGNDAVRRWMRDWESSGRADDIEFMVETARSRDTRRLTRGVLADYAIVKAANLFGSDPK